MKTFSKLFIAGCLLCVAPLVLACDAVVTVDTANKFKEMDKNGDGAISKKEFDAYHSAQFKKVGPES